MENNISRELSRFRPRMDRVDAQFDSRWTKQLREQITDLTTRMNSYRTIRRDFDEQRRKVDDLMRRNQPVPPEERTKLEQNQTALAAVEGEIASQLSGYLLFKVTHGPRDVIPQEIREPYENAYNAYLQQMNLDALRERTNNRLREHVRLLDGVVNLRIPVINPAPASATPAAATAPPATDPPPEAPAPNSQQ